MSEYFDWKYYINIYEDLKNTGIDNEEKARNHWIKHGKVENRICNPLFYFDWEYYISRYKDLKDLGIDNEDKARKHWINHGKKEGRICDIFDWEYYISRYKDLKDLGIDNEGKARKHWINHGKAENRICDIFDWEYYISIYEDLRYSSINNEEKARKHWNNYGKQEGRICDIFDWKYYISRYEDLRNASIDNEDKARIHWINHGKKEGRICNIEFNDFNIDIYNRFNDSTKNIAYIIYTNYKYLNNEIPNNIIWDGDPIRNIKTYDEIISLYNKNRLMYFIYSSNSFNLLYNDFDINYYKKYYNLEGNDIDIIHNYHVMRKTKKLIYNDRIKIVIYTPKIYVNCGGIVILHYIAKVINDLNYKNIYAKLYTYDGTKYKNEFCNDFADPFEINDNTIVIYPEIIKGNPLNAKNVIRWILLDLGLEMPLDHFINWNKSDIVYHWEPSKLQNTKQLTVPYFNTKIKKYNNTTRSGSCYLIKKGRFMHKNINNMHPSDSICIDDILIDEIINIFNKCKYFYCYDPNTFYILIAPLCGCITILYPLENYSKKDLFKNRMTCKGDYIFDSGIAYGNSNEEIQYAENTLNSTTTNFNKLLDLYKNDITIFLDNIYAYIKENIKLQTVNDIYY